MGSLAMVLEIHGPHPKAAPEYINVFEKKQQNYLILLMKF